MTPFDAIANRSPYLAQLTSGNGELASLFMKTLQGLYLFITDKKIDPSSITYSAELNSDGLIFVLKGKKNSTMVRDFYTRRMHDYGRIVSAVRGLLDLFRTIARYQAEHKGTTVKLSASGNKLIVNGERI